MGGSMRSSERARGLLEEARRVDGEIRSIHRRRNKDAVAIALLLLDMKERGLAASLGFESVAAYAAKALEYSASKTRDLVALALRLRDLPHARQSAEAGELPWTKLRTITSAATPANEKEWIDRARVCSSRDLELMAKVSRGEEPLEKIVIEVTASQTDIEDAAKAVLQENPELSFGAAI